MSTQGPGSGGGSMKVGVHYEDQAALVDRLRFVMAQLVDLRPFWPMVFRLYGTWVREAFAEQGFPVKWAPLTPKYAAWKALKYPGRGILVRERDMRDAYYAPIRQNLPHALVLTIDDPKAQFHEAGTVSMVRRSVMDALPPPIGINMGAAGELQRVAGEYVDELLARAGLLKLGPLPVSVAPLTINAGRTFGLL